MRRFPVDPGGQASPEFGIKENILKTRRFNLDVARDLEEIELGGSMIWAYAASDLNADVKIRLNDQLRDPITFSMGMFIRGTKFSRFFLSHDAQTGKWIEFVVAVEGDDTVEIINPALAFASISTTKATVLETIADVVMIAGATTQIVPANTARRSINIVNLLGGSAPLRIGDINVGPNRGAYVAVGENINLETTEAIYGYNSGGSNQDVSVLWTED